MRLTDPNFVYVSAADTAKPGYLHARMELYRQKVAEQNRLKKLKAKRMARRANSKAPNGS